MINLNLKFRQKKYPTNVLSFPLNFFLKKNVKLLGDLVLCKTIIEKESIKYKKNLNASWAHMIVHGTLHLLGYDHQNSKDQNIMENIENKIMLSLNYNEPYF